MQKGPVIGPMIICGVCFNEKDLDYLSKIGVKDSKKLTSKKRDELAKLIKEKCFSFKAIILSVKEIDQRETKNLTLNRLEELKFAEILNELKPDQIFLDAADVKEERFGRSINELLDYTPSKIISRHHADDIYPIVSASSIIAKDLRDKIIDDLKNKYGDMGSGYPSDKKTTDFIRNWIKKNKTLPPYVRKSWKTTKTIWNEELGNRKITDFIS